MANNLITETDITPGIQSLVASVVEEQGEEGRVAFLSVILGILNDQDTIDLIKAKYPCPPSEERRTAVRTALGSLICNARNHPGPVIPCPTCLMSVDKAMATRR